MIFGVVVGVGFFEGGYNHLLKTIALGRRRPDADPAPDVPAAGVRPAEQRGLRGDGDPAVRPRASGRAGWDPTEGHEKQRKTAKNTKKLMKSPKNQVIFHVFTQSEPTGQRVNFVLSCPVRTMKAR